MKSKNWAQWQRTCEFFVVLGNGQAFLFMPDIETVDILTIKCYTVDTLTQKKTNVQ